jgi:hypothetical protein
MSIQQSELVWRKPALVSDTTSNGGRMTHTAIASAVKNNIWPDVPQSERTAGSTKYRKVHIHVANDADLTLIAPKVFVETYTPGDDSVTIFPGTHTDTQATITGSERLYGCGQLNANVSASASEITVLTEGAALNFFRDNDTIRISNKTSIDDNVGIEEFHTIDGAPSYTGNVATITLDGTLANGFSASNTRVASVYMPGDIKGTVASWVETTVSGTYNEGTYPVLVDSIGGIEQNWTLTFSSATAFSVVGDTVGNVGSGNVSSDFTPSNPNFSKPYFKLSAAGWGGTWANGQTVTFTTHPAAIPIWYKRIVPAGASSLSGDKVVVAITGESE